MMASLGEVRIFASSKKTLSMESGLWLRCDGSLYPVGKYPILRQLQDSPNRTTAGYPIVFDQIPAWSRFHNDQTGSTTSVQSSHWNFSIDTNNKTNQDRKWVWVHLNRISWGNETAPPTVITGPDTFMTVVYSAGDDHWYFADDNAGTVYKSPDSNPGAVSLVSNQTLNSGTRVFLTNGSGTFVKSFHSGNEGDFQVSTDYCQTWVTVTPPGVGQSWDFESGSYHPALDMYVLQTYQNLCWTTPGTDPTDSANWNRVNILSETPRMEAWNWSDGVTRLVWTTSNNLRRYTYNPDTNTFTGGGVVWSVSNFYTLRYLGEDRFMAGRHDRRIVYSEDNGSTWTSLSEDFIESGSDIYKLMNDSTGAILAMGDTQANIAYLPNKNLVPVPRIAAPTGAGYYVRVR